MESYLCKQRAPRQRDSTPAAPPTRRETWLAWPKWRSKVSSCQRLSIRPPAPSGCAVSLAVSFTWLIRFTPVTSFVRVVIAITLPGMAIYVNFKGYFSEICLPPYNHVLSQNSKCLFSKFRTSTCWVCTYPISADYTYTALHNPSLNWILPVSLLFLLLMFSGERLWDRTTAAAVFRLNKSPGSHDQSLGRVGLRFCRVDELGWMKRV